jgi:actin-like ATPase involved in cell morphogenesis
MATAESGSWMLAIDFGTSFTVAATAGPDGTEIVYFGSGRTPVMPSGVFAQDDGSLFTGTDAISLRQIDPDRYVDTPKRRLGNGERTILLPDGPVPVVRVVSAVIRDAAAEAISRHGGTLPAGTVLTHPASWDDELQRVLRDAARDAGLSNVRVLVEPVAAALHLGRGRHQPGEHIAVYDLGGGTLDVAVLRQTAEGFQVAATGGRTDIGGEWFDEWLRERLNSGPLSQVEAWQRLSGPPPDQDGDFDAYLDWRSKQEQLKASIRRTKEDLSDKNAWPMHIPGYREGWTVTRETLEDVLREPLERTADVLAATITAAGLGPDQLSAIYLVGGASRTPLVTKLLSEKFPGQVKPQRDDPQTVVALGAAAGYQGAIDLDQPAQASADDSGTDPRQRAVERQAAAGIPAREAAQAELLREIALPEDAVSVLFAADLSRALANHARAGDWAPQFLTIVDLPSGKQRRLRNLISEAKGVALSRDGVLVATGNGQVVRITDAAAGRRLRNLSARYAGASLHVGVGTLMFSDDGRRLAGHNDGQWFVWDTATGRTLCSVRWGVNSRSRFRPYWKVLSPDGRWLAWFAGSAQQGKLKVWDAATGKQQRDIDCVGDYLLAYDGGLFATWMVTDSTVRAWDAGGGRQLLATSWPDGRGSAPQAEFSPGGHRLAVYGASGSAIIVDVASGELTCRLSHPTGPKTSVRAVAFSPSGGRLATAGAGTVHIWDSATGQLISRIADRDVRWLRFGSDDRSLATATQRELQLWRLADGHG